MRNRIPARNLSERRRVVARLLQDKAYASYAENIADGEAISSVAAAAIVDLMVLDTELRGPVSA